MYTIQYNLNLNLYLKLQQSYIMEYHMSQIHVNHLYIELVYTIIEPLYGY